MWRVTHHCNLLSVPKSETDFIYYILTCRKAYNRNLYRSRPDNFCHRACIWCFVLVQWWIQGEGISPLEIKSPPPPLSRKILDFVFFKYKEQIPPEKKNFRIQHWFGLEIIHFLKIGLYTHKQKEKKIWI